MPFFFLTIIFIISDFILALFKIINPKKKTPGLLLIAAIIGTVISIMQLKIPKPEIFTTNGNSMKDNMIYITAEKPFGIYYSTIPYEDPKKNGQKYNGGIPVNRSMTISAKSTLWKIIWSDLVSQDIVVGNDNTIDFIDNVEPGSSIKAISVTLIKDRFFPGDKISKSDLRVDGTTISEEQVIIDNYTIEPQIVTEGENTITVNYMNLSDSISLYVSKPSLLELDVQYNDTDIQVGELIDKGSFSVKGLYEDGNWKDEHDFQIFPDLFDESGNQKVTITVDGVSKEYTLYVKPREYVFTIVNELHSPNGSYDPKVNTYSWNENENYTVDGKTYSDGIIIKFDNWMSGLMGNGSDFREKVESNLYVAVNQELLSKRSPADKYMNGRLVVERETNGSTTTATVSILVDDVEVYNSGEISAVSTSIPEFHIDVKDAETIVFRTNAQVMGRPFLLGIIFE